MSTSRSPAPVVRGAANFTAKKHDAPTASDGGQLFVCVNGPAIEMLLMDRLVVPELVSDDIKMPLFWFATTLPKFNFVGVRLSAGSDTPFPANDCVKVAPPGASV